VLPLVSLTTQSEVPGTQETAFRPLLSTDWVRLVAVTRLVAADVATPDPPALVAVTITFSVCPTSAVTGV
jgi:hypothetical protein